MESNIRPSHIVGIGVSADGLAALEDFFKAMPENSGMAFVLVQHLSPDFKSLPDDLLARHTKMPIHRGENGLQLGPNAIYSIPPRQVMYVANGHLYLQERVGRHLIMPIDIFFESLAGAAQSKAIGIILSGTGSDGSRGIQFIHQAGGLVLVQTTESVQVDGMQRAYFNTGVCDYVTTPAEMPALVLEYARNPDGVRTSEAALSIVWDEGEYAAVFAHLRRGYGLDFSKYKPTTVERRIVRRLGFHQLQKLGEYVRLLESDPQELDALYHDLLIGVTEFFRDPAAFAYLEREVIPALFRDASSEGLRVWLAACATGEEAYSVAILLHEHTERINYRGKIAIFATDVHRKSLDSASQGVFEESRLQNVSATRLSRYFTPEGAGRYKIVPKLRKIVIFAPQNLISDPPFTKIDLVCCHNLLIYFQPETQEKAIASFNFSLRMGGVLFLGISEGLGKFADDFATIHPTYKLYRKTREIRLSLNINDTRGKPTALVPMDQPAARKHSVTVDRQTLHDYDQIVSRLLHAGFLLNEQHRILHYFGCANQYLKPPTGIAVTEFVELVDDDLRLPISVALQRAATLKGRFTLPNVALERGDEVQCLDITVDCIPYEKTSVVHYLVMFTPSRPSEATPSSAESWALLKPLNTSETLRTHITELELELQSARDNLQATVEELQTANEELQATNEELLASNEELQSTNEELYALNEELYTVNAQYEKKNAELQTLNNDHAHLLASLEIGVVFVDENLIIRRFNPASAAAFNLLPQDVGRPLTHIAYQLADQTEIVSDLLSVLSTGKKYEKEVQARSGEWLLKRVYPYLDDKQSVKGAILTFTDVTNIKTNEARLRMLFELMPLGVFILDKERRVVDSNPRAAAITALSHDALAHGGHRKRRYLRADGSEMPPDEFASSRAFAEQAAVYDIETGIVKEDGSIVWTSVNAAPLPDGSVVVVMGDITKTKESVQTLRRWKDVFENIAWGVVVGMPDGTLATMNPAFASMHGYTEGELFKTPISAIFAPECRDELPEHIRLIHEHGHHTFESKHIRRDGTVFPVQVDGVVVKNENGTPLYRIVSVQDITARKLAEQQLLESEVRFSQVFKNAGVPQAISTLETGKPLVVNDAFCELMGYDRDDLLRGKTTAELGIWEDPKDRDALLHEVLTIGRLRPREVRARHSSGSKLTLLVSAEMLSWQGQPCVIFAAIDLTARKKAERALQESQSRTEMALVGANAGTWEWNVQTGAVVFNERWAEIVGHTLLELEPLSIQTWIDLCHPDDLKVLRGLLQKHFAHETEHCECEARMRHKDGSWVWVIVHGRVMAWDEHGKPLRMFGTQLDVTARKQAEQKLRESEGILKLLQKIGNMGTWRLDLRTNKVDWSENCAAMYGFMPNETPPTIEALSKMIHPDDWHLIEREGAALLRDPRTMTREFRIFDKGGPMKWVRNSMTLLLENGQVVALTGVQLDITERKQAEENLRRSEENYRGLLKTIDSAIVTIDAEGKFVYMNDEAARQLGGSVEELTGKRMHDIFPEEYATPQMAFVLQALREDRGVHFESETVVRGERRWYRTSIQPIHDENGAVVLALMNATDIDDLKSVQHELLDLNRNLEARVQQATAEIQDLYNNAPGGYQNLDADGRVLVVNATELGWLGRTQEEVLGHSFTEFILPEQVEQFETRHLRNIVAGQAVQGFEYDLVRRDGSTMPVMLNSMAVMDEKGHFIRSRSTLVDVTERRKAELALRESHRELMKLNIALQHASRAKNEFLANMSHELRTPLNGILGMSEILASGLRGALDDRQKQMLAVVDASGRHLLSLINDILDLSKIEADKVELNLEPASVSDLCHASLSFIKESAFNKGIKLDFRKEDDDALTNAQLDVRRMKQILVNLLSNAVKFTARGGLIRLEVRVDRSAHRIEFSVSDTGIGIAPEDHERIFAPFVQVDNTLTRTVEGTGLGLTLVKRLAELHGGSVALESAMGKGSRFTVSLPWQEGVPASRAQREARQQAVDHAASLVDQKKDLATILIAEDNPTNFRVVGEYLDARGYSIIGAVDGEEALAKAVESVPDLILMDIQMPKVDGLEVTRRLRADPQFKQTPIIALTARAMKGDRERCLEAGATDYVSKPVNLKMLLELIERLLS